MTLPVLTVISDTPMQRRGARLYALEVVVRELQALAPHFSKVVWYGFEQPLLSDAMVEVPPHIECHLWTAVGGTGLRAKLAAAASLPRYLAVAHQALSAPGVVHVRGPGLPALCVALRAQLGSTARVWFKYAGAWAPPSLPRSYRLYRTLVRRARRSVVTMTGATCASIPHVVSLENPCLTEGDREQGAIALQAKRFDGPLTACFVGRVEAAKGFDRILEALSRRPERFARLLVAGRVADEALQRAAQQSPVPVEFLGALEREQLNAVYAQSQVLLLPSRSEGFPKVVAEGWNFGCVPITSDVGALATEVSDQHGYVWREAGHPPFASWFNTLDVSSETLNNMARQGYQRAADFMYDRYVNRLMPLLSRGTDDLLQVSTFDAQGNALQSEATQLAGASALTAFLQQVPSTLPPDTIVLLHTPHMVPQLRDLATAFAASGDDAWDLRGTPGAPVGIVAGAHHDVAAFHASAARVAGAPMLFPSASALILRGGAIPASWSATDVYESANAVVAELAWLWYRHGERARVAPRSLQVAGSHSALPEADAHRLLRRTVSRTDYLLAAITQWPTLGAVRAFRAARATPSLRTNAADARARALTAYTKAAGAEAPQVRVSVVLPTKGRYPYLAEILEDIRAQSVPPCEVIIGDANEEGDREPSFYESFTDLPLRVEWLPPGQRGVSSARNRCLQHATGNYIWFLDDDSRVAHDNLANHLELLQSGAAQVSVGPAYTKARPELLPTQATIGAARMDCGTTLADVALVRAVGGFDPAFDEWMQGEDADLGDRFTLCGATILNNPAASRFHYLAPVGGTRTSAQAAHRWRRWSWSSRPSPAVYYRLRKNFGEPAALVGVAWAALVFGFRRRQLEGQPNRSRLETVLLEVSAAPLSILRFVRSISEARRALVSAKPLPSLDAPRGVFSR